MMHLIARVSLPVALFAAAIMISGDASALTPQGCLTFQKPGKDAKTISIKNNCEENRRAKIEWCNGTKQDLRVASLGSRSVRLFPGCKMEILADAKDSPKPLDEAATSSHKSAPAYVEATLPASSPLLPNSQSLKPAKLMDYHSALWVSGSPLWEQNPVQDDSARTSIQAIADAADAKVIGGLRESLLIPSSVRARFPAKVALSPALSEKDWSALECSESGQSLIRQAQMLLDRKAKLQRALSEIWFSTDALKRQKEWVEADRELQAVNRDLSMFPVRVKAIIVKVQWN